MHRDYAPKFASQVVGTSLSWNEAKDSGGIGIYLSLSRMEEVLNRDRDQWGNWDWQDPARPSAEENYMSPGSTDRWLNCVKRFDASSPPDIWSRYGLRISLSRYV